MKDSEAIALLAQHGKLIKRPFLLGKDGGTVGFKEEVWKALV
jgi:arsenate reductase-like glutaredoxin family protein